MKKVLIIDDSALIRKLLTQLLSSAPGLQVVGAAKDPYEAREMIKASNPDVLTLDVEMPKMDGLTFLRNLMRLRPMPVLMVSSLTEEGAETTLAALELGAVDYVTKPKFGLQEALTGYRDELIEKVETAAKAPIRALDRNRPAQGAAGQVTPRFSADAILSKKEAAAGLRTTDRVIALGGSTGGTEAIREVLERLPADCPGIVIAQHIPEVFSARFARRLDATCQVKVTEAKDGDQIVLGRAFVAPGNRHLLVRRSGAKYYCELNDGPPVNRHKPSVDVLFRSLAQAAGLNAVAAILTGMGADGADGLKEVLDAGGATIAQDQETSVVWGCGEAVKRGSAQTVLPLERIAGKILSALSV